MHDGVQVHDGMLRADAITGNTLKGPAIAGRALRYVCRVSLHAEFIKRAPKLPGKMVLWPAVQVKNGTLRADTITRDKLKGPAHGGYVSDLEARINDGDKSLSIAPCTLSCTE